MQDYLQPSHIQFLQYIFQTQLLKRLAKQLNEEDNVTIIQVTHSETNAAYATKIINLLDGSITK